MATTNSAIRKAHDDILRSFDAEAKWTIITAARGFRIEEHEGLLKEFDGKQLREGDLSDFIEEFQNFDPPGSMLFAPIKLKVQNSQPKCALLQWYAPDAIPKSYFIGQCQTLQKLLPGFTVPIDIRDRDGLTADDIIQKVGGAAPQRDTTRPPPPPKGSKPTVFRPVQVAAGGGGFNARARAPQSTNEDNDGWGADAPPVTRSQLEKVESAYKPTTVDLGQVRSQQEPSRFTAPARDDSTSGDVVKGGYQPIGKVDIAAIRRQAKESGNAADDRPTTVKGAYEPVGKVDIAAIRAKAQGPGGAAPSASNISPARTGGSAQDDDDERPKSLAERSAAFHQSERLATLPKPKVVNKFGAGAGTFTGTKAPAPAGFGPKPAAAAPVGIASRTFADEGGKTPAQIWAEKKARQGGASPTPSPGFGTQPASIASQASGDGGWKSGYSGKSWAPVQTTHTGKSAGSDLSAQRTGQQEQEQEDPSSPAGGVGAIRDRFKNAAPISMGAPPPRAVPEERTPLPPPTDLSSKPNAGVPRGVPIPGLPPRPTPAEEEYAEEQDYAEADRDNRYEEEDVPKQQTHHLPPPPTQPRSPSPPTPDEMRSGSPIRVAMPVGRGGKTDIEPVEQESGPPLPSRSIAEALPDTKDLPGEPRLEDDEPGRATAQATAGAEHDTDAYVYKIVTAIFDHESDPNDHDELDLHTGEPIFDIEIKDKDSGWWWGTNEKGQRGTFPENYVTAGKSAIAQYEFDGEDEGELSFKENGIIVDVEDKGDGWSWGRTLDMPGSVEAEGLFPTDYIVFRD